MLKFPHFLILNDDARLIAQAQRQHYVIMTSIHDIIENPLLRDLHTRQKSALITRFPALSACSHGYFLSLGKYLNVMPQQFYSESVYLEYLEWLKETDRKASVQLQSYLLDNATEIDRALLHLEEINGFDWHDSFQKIDDYEFIRFVDQQVHPTYLRLVEAVFSPFLRVVAHFSRIDRGKGTEGLDVWSIVQELRGRCLDEALYPYHHIIRNGIGHGGVTYLENAICYRDKKGNEKKYYDFEIVRICDDLLDACNAFTLALSVFLLAQQSDGYKLPKQLLIEELRAETRSPWWEIVGCTPSQFSGGNQLIVYARPRTSDYLKIQWATFQSGILAERFAPGFDRYFFSLRSEKSLPCFSAFDGKKLKILREQQRSSLEDYGDIIENKLVFYVPHFHFPRRLGKLETLLFAFRIKFPQLVEDFRKQQGLAKVYVRNIKIHRNSWGSVVNGSVYITLPSGRADQETIRKSCSRIFRKALSHARREVSRLDATRYVPLGFARIAVFQNNYRKRHLSDYGLGKDLICTVQLQRLGKIRSPDIIGSTIEEYGKYRIAWNKAWLDNFKVPTMPSN